MIAPVIAIGIWITAVGIWVLIVERRVRALNDERARLLQGVGQPTKDSAS
jgi:hypothetical protein